MNWNYLFILVVLGFSAFFSTIAQAQEVSFELLATIDYPGYSSTYVYGINDESYVIGTANDSVSSFGFFRSPDGRLSGRIIAPAGATALYGINNLGQACGAVHGHGTILSDRHFTDVFFGGEDNAVMALNDSGNYCGYYNGTGDLYSAFARIDGSDITFEIPGAAQTYAFGMNNLNQVVGKYNTDSGEVHGFVRNTDGRLIYPIDVRDADYTEVRGINDRGWIVGKWTNSRAQKTNGVLFVSLAPLATYEYPGALTTTFWDINNRGLITGEYSDNSGAHGFVVRVRFTAEDLSISPLKEQKEK